MRTRFMVFTAVFFVMTMLAAGSLYADCGSYKSGKGYGGMYGWGKRGMEDKVIQKAHFFLKNQEELGLSEEQVAEIKDLKTASKKDVIRKDAEINVIAIDIKSALYEDTVDVDAVNKLVDKKYDVKKARTKALVKAYADIKNVLSEEQMAKAKEIWMRDE